MSETEASFIVIDFDGSRLIEVDARTRTVAPNGDQPERPDPSRLPPHLRCMPVFTRNRRLHHSDTPNVIRPRTPQPR